MKTISRIGLILYVCLIPWQQVYGQMGFAEPNWDRALAVNAAKSVDTNQVLKTLYQSTQAGNSTQVLETLHAVQQNEGWPVPAREYTIWSFTIGLADMRVNSVSARVLNYLSAYELRTLVAHDDRDSVGVPLFNIRVAASGVRNSWARQLGESKAGKLLQSDSARWIDAYIDATATERRGFSDALDFASDEQLEALARSAIERLADHPDLTVIAGKSAIILDDQNLLQQTLSFGSGPELHHILRAASASLDAEGNRALLFHVISRGPELNAGLAIAQLAPALLDNLAVREKMFEMLGSQNLGASAALVLGSSSDPEIRARIKSIAAEKDGLISKRASLAVATSSQGMEAGQ